MALDSATKRQAVPGCGRPWMRGQFPVAAKTEGWRVSVGNAYPVAGFGAFIPPDEVGGIIMLWFWMHNG